MSALERIRVLELGQVIAGTFAGMILADLGADVIKIEAPRGDLGRNPQIAPLGGESALFLTFNRGKKSVVIDLKKEGGLAVLDDLVRHSDVVIDNFRPGVLDRIGAGHDRLAGINPGVVSCSITGFGEGDAERTAPSFDLIHQALSGLLSVTGERDGPPVRIGIPLADVATPMFALHGILAALVARQFTGQGQRIDVSMFQAMTFLHTYDAVIYLNGGEQPHAWGTQHAHHVPWQAFETSDGHIVVATREEVFWKNLCRAIGLPELAADPRFAENAGRVAHREELIPILAERITRRTSAEWMGIFRAGQVPAAPVNDLAGALAERALNSGGGGVIEVPFAPLGSLRMLANPVRMSDGEPRRSAPPLLGEHTRQVLGAVAGYRPEAIAELERRGVVASRAKVADRPL
ncbi:MAG: CaiB/BaiF CoA transferase family protein [Candidatus Dormibacteraceae bacterium]